jgi:hypothetical protein
LHCSCFLYVSFVAFVDLVASLDLEREMVDPCRVEHWHRALPPVAPGGSGTFG